MEHSLDLKNSNLQLGLKVLGGLAVLTALEYWIAVGGFIASLPVLAIITLAKSAVILTAFMHIAKVFRSQESHGEAAGHGQNLAAQIFNNRMVLWLFIFSDSIVFLAFLASRYYILGTARPPEVNQPLGLFLTSLLLLSSFFANRADIHVAQGENASFQRNILITIVMGLVFLCLVVLLEWPEAMHFAPPGTPYGTALFSMTGLHAIHIVSGLIILLIAFFKARRGGYSAQNHWGAEASVIYWHFVDVVWVFVYITLYLVK